MECPEILTTQDNTWIIGLTQEPSTRAYYVIFYYDIYAILGKIIQRFNYFGKKYMPYSDFDEFREIGSGGYGTVHTAKYKYHSLSLSYVSIPEYVVLKRFKRFDGTPELFINEVSTI